MDYPFSYVWVNGRKVSLKEIQLGAQPLSEHEKDFFSFIREWLSGQDKFTLSTSGSTGTPKKITITRDQMVSSATLTHEAVHLKRHSNALICIDSRYIGGKMMVVRSFVTGMSMFFVDPCANPLIRLPVDQTIHFTALVPYQVNSILASKHPHLLDCIHTMLIGGAPLDEAVYSQLQKFSPRIFLTYAMTETVSHVALHEIHSGDNARIYKTLPGVSVFTDKRGCLMIDAPFLKETVITNDVVEIINKREFLWKGRADNIINSGGVKISPEGLEEKIGQIFTRSHLLNEFFIHGVDDKRLGQKAVLILKSPLPDASTLGQVVQALQHSIPAYEVPKEIYETTAFIYTHTHKVNRIETFKSARLVRSVAQ